jgi:hypothetical protein
MVSLDRIAARYAALFATFTKLRDGSWGLRVPGKASAGQSVQVLTKSGQKSTKVVGKVLWSGADPGGSMISLCTINEGEASVKPGPSRRRNEDDECEVCGKNKWTCGHQVGW